jgi:4-amino-4-deoxy-L-arabinose transferase-like glycosyltransferase
MRTSPSDRTLLWITGISTAVKLLLALFAERNAPILDEGAYLSLARNLAASGHFQGTFRPPLYPAFEAIFLGSGLGTLGIRLAQVILSTASVFLVYRIALRETGERAARIAAFLMAFSPTLIAFSHRLWSETLFIFLLLLAIDLLARPVAAGNLGRWVGAGVLLGLAALTRPMLVTFLPFLGAWLLFRVLKRQVSFPPALARFAALSATMLLVILPWTIRNRMVSGDFVLIDSNGAFNILVGAQPESRFVDKDDVWSYRFGRVDDSAYVDMVAREPGRAQALAMDGAMNHIRQDLGGFVAKSWWEAGHLWTTDSFLLRHLRNGWYGALPGWIIPLVTLLAVGWFVVVILAGFAGITAGAPSDFRSLLLLLLVQFTLLFGATYALSRYAVPLQALLVIPAGAVLAHRREIAERLRSGLIPGHRLVFLGLALIGLSLAWIRDLPLLKDMIVSGGSHHRFHMEEAPGSADRTEGQ